MRICPKCSQEHADDVAYCPIDGVRLAALDQPPAEAQNLKPGVTLGSYRLLELLGEGGMGFVFLAEHTGIGRRVALKALRREYIKNEEVLRRFFGEARAVNQINHPNIVEITDFIENPNGESYYVMEFLEGMDLGRLLAERGHLEPAVAIALALQIADALTAVHRAGIIHRDLKTENIFLLPKPDGSYFVKLLDFGLAKMVESQAHRPLRQTAEGVILGTPEYMSPEQASGKKLDHRTDIYSLGVILYEIVVGKKPFVGQSFSEIAIQHVTQMPTRPRRYQPKLPRKLEQLILRCLAKDPADRPQHMFRVREELRILSGLSPVFPVVRSRSRVAFFSLAVLAAAVLLVLSALELKPKIRPDLSNAQERKHVNLALDTIPSGAEVLRGEGGASVGQTPLTLTLEWTAARERFEFRLNGHKPVKELLAATHDTRLLVTLMRTPIPAPLPSDQPVLPAERPDERPDERPGERPSKQPRKPSRTSSDSEATLNPFLNRQERP